MATWQYSIHLVSREELLQDRSKLPKSITEDERERLIGWQASTNLKVVDEIISKYLEKKKSWSEAIEQWGEEESHCIQIYHEDGAFPEISIRLDLRSLNRDFLNSVIKLAEVLKASLLDDEGNVFEPNISNLKSKICSSDAFKFVKDPKAFLVELTEVK